MEQVLRLNVEAKESQLLYADGMVILADDEMLRRVSDEMAKCSEE